MIQSLGTPKVRGRFAEGPRGIVSSMATAFGVSAVTFMMRMHASGRSGSGFFRVRCDVHAVERLRSYVGRIAVGVLEGIWCAIASRDAPSWHSEGEEVMAKLLRCSLVEQRR